MFLNCDCVGFSFRLVTTNFRHNQETCHIATQLKKSWSKIQSHDKTANDQQNKLAGFGRGGYLVRFSHGLNWGAKQRPFYPSYSKYMADEGSDSMASENIGASSLEAESLDSEVEKKDLDDPTPPPETTQSTSSDVAPSIDSVPAGSNECFYSDIWPLCSSADNSSAHYNAGNNGCYTAAPIGSAASMLSPSMQYHTMAGYQNNWLIPTMQILPASAGWSDMRHTCGRSCYQTESKCPKRQANRSDWRDRQEKYSRPDLGSGQIVERCGFGTPRRHGRRDSDRSRERDSDRSRERNSDRSRDGKGVDGKCGFGMPHRRGGRDSDRSGDGKGVDVPYSRGGRDTDCSGNDKGICAKLTQTLKPRFS